MTRLCPRGHPSETDDDYCDECGLPMAPAPTPPGVSEVASLTFNGRIAASSNAPVQSGGPPLGASATADPTGGEVCPLCGTPRAGRFCEEDGHDFALAGASAGSGASTSVPRTETPGAPPPRVRESSSPALAAVGWTVTVEADRAYFDSVLARQGPDIDTVAFPTYYPRQVVVLSGDEVRIGRRRVTGAGADPDVDLSGPPLDPGVSHLHAVLLPDGEGGWNLLDPGSTNGTTVNGADRTIPVDTLVPLRPGDRVHVGAYTTLVVNRLED